MTPPDDSRLVQMIMAETDELMLERKRALLLAQFNLAYLHLGLGIMLLILGIASVALYFIRFPHAQALYGGGGISLLGLLFLIFAGRKIARLKKAYLATFALPEPAAEKPPLTPEA